MCERKPAPILMNKDEGRTAHACGGCAQAFGDTSNQSRFTSPQRSEKSKDLPPAQSVADRLAKPVRLSDRRGDDFPAVFRRRTL